VVQGGLAGVRTIKGRENKRDRAHVKKKSYFEPTGVGIRVASDPPEREVNLKEEVLSQVRWKKKVATL